MDITSLEIQSDADGGSKVTAWCKCRSAEDIDDLVAWLGLARHMLVAWQSIRASQSMRQVDKAENVTALKPEKKP